MKVLDLFCCGGGAALGYHKAGFDVVGVDIKKQPNYPFEFYQADATEFPLDGFDFIHASPPCQSYSKHVVSDGKWDRTEGKNELKLIDVMRDRFVKANVPYIIENVMGAKDDMQYPIQLCGTMFGLPIPRHRLFESSFELIQPEHKPCSGVAKRFAEFKGWEYRDMTVTGKGRHAGTSDRWKEIMGIEPNFKITQHCLREAIPPSFTEYLGLQVKAYLMLKEAA